MAGTVCGDIDVALWWCEVAIADGVLANYGAGCWWVELGGRDLSC